MEDRPFHCCVAKKQTQFYFDWFICSNQSRTPTISPCELVVVVAGSARHRKDIGNKIYSIIPFITQWSAVSQRINTHTTVCDFCSFLFELACVRAFVRVCEWNFVQFTFLVRDQLFCTSKMRPALASVILLLAFVHLQSTVEAARGNAGKGDCHLKQLDTCLDTIENISNDPKSADLLKTVAGLEKLCKWVHQTRNREKRQ